MDQLTLSLVPVFAAGLAIQQLLEILDPMLVKVIGNGDKKLILGLISLTGGLTLSFGMDMRVLAPMGVLDSDLLDGLVTALIISAGTEAFNSILKYLGYSKESAKNYAAITKAEVKRDYIANDLLFRMDNRK